MISGLALALPPLGLFVAPVAFGVAIALARRCRMSVGIVLVASSCVAWILAILTGTFAIGLELLPPMRGFWPGLLSGATGALVVALAYQVCFRSSDIVIILLIAGSTGAILGATTTSASIYLSDRGSSRFDFTCLIAIWQIGVATSLAISEWLCEIPE